jgi:sec-independent protein translocase protein TatB
MPQIGPLEIMVVCVVALIVFGPTRLPDIARQVGKALAELRRQASDVRSEFQSGMNINDMVEDDEVEDEQPGPAATPAATSADTDAPPDGTDELPIDERRVADGAAPVTDAPTRELGYPAATTPENREPGSTSERS